MTADIVLLITPTLENVILFLLIQNMKKKEEERMGIKHEPSNLFRKVCKYDKLYKELYKKAIVKRVKLLP